MKLVNTDNIVIKDVSKHDRFGDRPGCYQQTRRVGVAVSDPEMGPGVAALPSILDDHIDISEERRQNNH